MGADRTAGIGLAEELVSGRRMVAVDHMVLDLEVVHTDWVADSHSRRLEVVVGQAAEAGCNNRPEEVVLRWQLVNLSLALHVLFRFAPPKMASSSS